MGSFHGKTALVTGGTRGIGTAIVERLVADGARVLLTGTNARAAADVASRVSERTGGEAIGVRCDVSDERSVSALASTVQSTFGSLDLLVSNAAIARRNRIEDITLAEWNEVMSTNVTGPFLVTRGVKPLMPTGSAIVIVASQAGKRGEALLSHYAASKAALINMTKSFALEFAPDIRVNAVCPGFIETDMIFEHYEVQAAFRGVAPGVIRSEMLSRIPLGRMQPPESIASVVAFLAGTDASDMTGQAINVTGGMIME